MMLTTKLLVLPLAAVIMAHLACGVGQRRGRKPRPSSAQPSAADAQSVMQDWCLADLLGTNEDAFFEVLPAASHCRMRDVPPAPQTRALTTFPPAPPRPQDHWQARPLHTSRSLPDSADLLQPLSDPLRTH